MKIKAIVDEDFNNYKLPSMFIGLGTCDFKCCKEANIPTTICQNSELARQKDIEVSADEIFSRYTSNTLTSAIVLGGLEVLSMREDVISLIKYFRTHDCNDTFVIYTGYYIEEIQDFIKEIKPLGNIVMKTGRFIPNNQPHYDKVLGVDLISDNQYGRRIC